MLIATDFLNKAALAEMVAGVLDGTYIGLYVKNLDNSLPVLAHDTVIGDLVVPAGDTAKVRQAAVWSDVFDAENDAYEVMSGLMTFGGDTVHPEAIVGWYIADALTAGNLLYAEQFAEQQTLNVDDDDVSFVARLKFGDITGSVGEGTVI